MDRLQLQYQS